MKILNRRIYFDLVAFTAGLLILAWLLVICFTGIVRFYENLGIIWGSIFAIAGIILVAPFIGIMCLCLPAFKTQIKMLNLSIFIDDNGGLLITNPPLEYRIHKSNIKHILKGDLATTIVWSPPDCSDSIKTFFVRKQYFPTKEYKKFIEQLSTYECFSDDNKENTEIRRQLGLNRIFRKNKLESEL